MGRSPPQRSGEFTLSFKTATVPRMLALDFSLGTCSIWQVLTKNTMEKHLNRQTTIWKKSRPMFWPIEKYFKRQAPVAPVAGNHPTLTPPMFVAKTGLPLCIDIFCSHRAPHKRQGSGKHATVERDSRRHCTLRDYVLY